MNLTEEETHEITHVLKCPVGTLPFKYLGVPVHFEKLKREHLHPVVDKLIRRAVGWRGRYLGVPVHFEKLKREKLFAWKNLVTCDERRVRGEITTLLLLYRVNVLPFLRIEST
jgi:hypothetical protein